MLAGAAMLPGGAAAGRRQQPACLGAGCPARRELGDGGQGGLAAPPRLIEGEGPARGRGGGRGGDGGPPWGDYRRSFKKKE